MKMKTNYGELNLEMCPAKEGDEFDVISHRSLADVCDNQLRGKFAATFDVIKGNATHALVKCRIEDTDTKYTVEELGEKIRVKTDSNIALEFPVTAAYTRAFDRAMIRILGLEGKFYSDEELSNGGNKYNFGITNSTIASDDTVTIDDESLFVDEDPVETEDDAVVVIESDSEDYDDVDEAEIAADANDTIVVEEDDYQDIPDPEEPEESTVSEEGKYVFTSGSKKGSSLNEIYSTTDGKSWLDYYLGGQYGKREAKVAIVKFYLANDIPEPSGTTENAKAAAKIFNEIKAELKG